MEMLSASRSRKLDVLVVDDDEAGLCDLTGSLKRAGLTCDGASTGWEALEILLKGTRPSVVVTDIRMPELDGIELAQRLTRMELSEQPVNAGAKMHRLAGVKVRHG